MTVELSAFQMLSPRSLREALELLGRIEGARPFAGGTDLMVELESGRLAPCVFVNLQSVPELAVPLNIDSRGGLCLGALTTFRDTRLAAAVRESFPMLARAAAEVGTPAVQSSATWVGNIANGSPAADGVPALMVHDARLEISGIEGTREMNLADFYTGYKTNSLQPGEIITQVRLPPREEGWRDYYRKVGTRRFQAISKTLLAGRLRMAGDGSVVDIRLALASVAPFPFRARATERLLQGKILTEDLILESVRSLRKEILPIDDIRSTSTYRRQVSGNLLRDFLAPVKATAV